MSLTVYQKEEVLLSVGLRMKTAVKHRRQVGQHEQQRSENGDRAVDGRLGEAGYKILDLPKCILPTSH